MITSGLFISGACMAAAVFNLQQGHPWTALYNAAWSYGVYKVITLTEVKP